MRMNQLCSSLLCSLALAAFTVNCTQREPSSPESSPSMETTGTGTPSDLGAGSAGTDAGMGDSSVGTMGTTDGMTGSTDGTMGDTTGTSGSTAGTTETAPTTGTETNTTETMSDSHAATTHEECKNMTGKAMDDCMKKMHAKGDKAHKAKK